MFAVRRLAERAAHNRAFSVAACCQVRRKPRRPAFDMEGLGKMLTAAQQGQAGAAGGRSNNPFQDGALPTDEQLRGMQEEFARAGLGPDAVSVLGVAAADCKWGG
jgi:hypothetical protein